MDDYTKIKFKNRLLGSREPNSATDILLVVIAIFMVILLLVVCFFQMCTVMGTSMYDTLDDGDRLLITNYSVEYKYGDIIVLDQPDENEPGGYIRLIKRVIATEGEQFYFYRSGGFVHIYKKDSDGKFDRLPEPYILENMKASDSFEKHFAFYNPSDTENTIFTVPKDCVLFMGDNRNDSKDSRYYSYAKTDYILGKMVYKVVPNTLSGIFLIFIFG